MAAVLISASLLLFQSVSAASIDLSDHKRANGFCKQLDIPVSATADSAIYDIPRVDNDIETVAWEIYSDTWSTPEGDERIIQRTTTSDTFNIHAKLCVPRSSDKKKDNILQIATHGGHYDSRYWDPELDREKQSYVEAALKAGYSILTYDRLGVGLSDKPDAYTVVQAPLELEILRQLTLMARDGTLYKSAGEAKPSNEAFDKLAKPDKVVHVGHSFGSFLTSAFLAKYGPLSDGAIITGYLVTEYLGKPGMASFNAEYAATASPPGPYERSSGYIVCQKSGIQTTFFAGDPQSAFTKEMLDYGDAIKQPIPIGEFASAYHIQGLKGPSFKGPIQYMLAEFDFYVCYGDCKGIYKEEDLKITWPNAADIDIDVQPNTGHAFTLHNNATAGYQVSFDFLAKHGL